VHTKILRRHTRLSIEEILGENFPEPEEEPQATAKKGRCYPCSRAEDKKIKDPMPR